MIHAQPQTLRDQARAIFARAVKAADPALGLRQSLASQPFPCPVPGGRTFLIAVGKAAPLMLEEAIKHVRGPFQAMGVTHYENTQIVPGATILQAGHPVPDENGLQASKSVIRLLSSATRKDQVIALISGGGSALLPAPVPGVGISDKAMLNQLLLSSGLDIVQMNLIRQQLSQLKGGGFLRHAAPAPVTAYILSDVIGNDLRAVASGPTVSPIGTHADARRSCIEANIWPHLPEAIRGYLDQSLPPVPQPPKATNILIGSNRHSLDAALAAANRDFDAHIISDALTGDVADAAERIVEACHSHEGSKPTALLFGGETTVEITGTGLGGRNQELALRVAQKLTQSGCRSDWVFLSGGTDGRDGPTTAAGGIVDANTVERIGDAGLSISKILDNNDSFHALQASGDLLITDATGTNVADIQCLLLVPRT